MQTTKHSQQVVYLVPVAPGVGLTSVSMGLVRAIDRKGMRVAFFKPVAQLFRGDTGPERSTYVIRNTTELNPPDPIPYSRAESAFGSGGSDKLMEEIMELFHETASDADVVVVEGLINMDDTEHAAELNHAIARTLDAAVILVGAPIRDDLKRLNAELLHTCNEFGGIQSGKVLGAIVNFVNAPRDRSGHLRPDLSLNQDSPLITRDMLIQECGVFKQEGFRLLGCVTWQHAMATTRTVDLAEHLNARILHEGQMRHRRVHKFFLCARTVEHITHVFQPNALLIIPVDRVDLIIAACMAALNGVPIAGVLLTSAGEPDPGVMKLCRNALGTGLPVLSVPTDSFSTATHIPRMNTEVPIDDMERIEMGMNHVASNIDHDWIGSLMEAKRETRLSPAAFRYQLVLLARKAAKRIVLPEGDEPRTLQAAQVCAERGIARCVLLGKPDRIRDVADQNGITLHPDLEILDPEVIREQYVEPLVEQRKHKGMDRAMALSVLEDPIMLGTVMLHEGTVDGLVSGAVHTTAETVRPALQIIKTRPGNQFVSSLFFMLLPDQVCIYADCAIHEDPDAATLAEIAIQSADSARAFGIHPRVAMISYSTGDSGKGSDVDKVREATRLAREKRPDLLLDGPLQYDAASTSSVARTKAPNSQVAGRASVYIFPDLNTGNTTYKAVQRSAKVISIGPMLQGLRKPVNDLSRGALVEDIIYTIALTAIQATQV